MKFLTRFYPSLREITRDPCLSRQMERIKNSRTLKVIRVKLSSTLMKTWNRIITFLLRGKSSHLITKRLQLQIRGKGFMMGCPQFLKIAQLTTQRRSQKLTASSRVSTCSCNSARISSLSESRTSSLEEVSWLSGSSTNTNGSRAKT